MVAMAAIVAQNGATGQSLVEQFTTGELGHMGMDLDEL